MTMVAVFAAMNMNAQVYVGGSVGLVAPRWAAVILSQPIRSFLRLVTT